MKSFLQNNNIEMYSTYNEGKSVNAERFIRTLKNKIYQYMTSVSKNVYKNTYKTIKMKPDDVKPSIYIDFNKENNKEGPKYRVGDNARISKYKNVFANVYLPNSSEKFFVIRKLKNTVPLTYVISDLYVQEIVGTFYEKKLQKTDQKEFRVEKVVKKKGMVVLLIVGFTKRTI